MNGLRSPAGPREFILLMSILMSVVAISIDAMLPALGIIGIDLGATHANQAQYIISFIFAGMAIGQLINGPLSDALGRKKILYSCLCLYILGSMICVLATDITTMLVGRFIQGLGVSGPYISIMSIIRDRYSGREMAKIMSLVMTIFIMVPVIAPAIGQGILAVANWRYIFGFYLLYSTIVGIWMYLRLEETLKPNDRVPFRIQTLSSGIKAVFTNKTTLCYTLALSCIFGALIGNLNSIQQVFHSKYQVGDMFAVYFGLQALAFGFASFMNAKLVEKLGMRNLCLFATGFLVVIAFVFIICSMLIGAHSGSISALVPCCFFQ